MGESFVGKWRALEGLGGGLGRGLGGGDDTYAMTPCHEHRLVRRKEQTGHIHFWLELPLSYL